VEAHPARRHPAVPRADLDIYEKSGKSGPMAFVVRETTITDADNDVVAKVRGITVVRL